MAWRRWNNAIHRDFGYLCAGLTLIYAVSGVAVNHVADWNPNYRIERGVHQVAPVAPPAPGDRAAVRAILESLDLPTDFRTTFQRDSATIRIFLKDGVVDLEPATGRATVELVQHRALLYTANALHLNSPKQLWTWVADLYAGALALLAITGLFVLKGKKGITGRGAWLTAIGVAVPAVFIWLYL
jgi:hypothetical protein